MRLPVLGDTEKPHWKYLRKGVLGGQIKTTDVTFHVLRWLKNLIGLGSFSAFCCVIYYVGRKMWIIFLLVFLSIKIKACIYIFVLINKNKWTDNTIITKGKNGWNAKVKPKWTNCNVFPSFAIVCIWKWKFSLLTALSQLSALTPMSHSSPCDPSVALLGQTLPTMKFLRGTESRVWPSKAAFLGRHKGWGWAWGLLWELSSLAARADPQLLGEQNGAWETVPLASLWKWMAENEWFAKENNPQVDQVLEKSADCSREIIESVWMVT